MNFFYKISFKYMFIMSYLVGVGVFLYVIQNNTRETLKK